MTSSHRLRSLTALLAALLAATLVLGGCAATGDGRVAAADGIGGTGVDRDGDGIGGTGIDGRTDGIGGTGVRSDPDGIGGTGAVAKGDGIGGTGIIGVVTALDRVVVNGLEIVLPDGLEIGFNGRPETPDALRIGHVVEVLASGTGPVLDAERVDVHDAVVGRITALDRDEGELTVLAHRIVIDERTRLATALERLQVGDRVRVSGLRRDDRTVVATRIERALADEPAAAAGVVTGPAPGGFRLGDLRVRSGVPVLVGDRVQVQGREVGETLVAAAALARESVPFAGANRIVVQGIARKAPDEPAVRVGAVTASVTDRTRYQGVSPETLEDGERAVVSSSVLDDGTLEADSVVADRPGSTPTDGLAPPPTPAPRTPGASAPPPADTGKRTRGVIDAARPAAVTTEIEATPAAPPDGTADAAEPGGSGDSGGNSGDASDTPDGGTSGSAGASDRDATRGAVSTETRDSVGGSRGGASLP